MNIGIENVDLTCDFGNALENDLEVCIRVPEDQKRENSVTVKYFDKRVRIMLENASRAVIAFDGELPSTL